MVERLGGLKSDPVLRFRVVDDPVGRIAHARMARAVFGHDAASIDARLPPIWTAVALFDADGSCVAGAEIANLAIVADGKPIDACGIRRVGVIEPWRGHGLLRRLMGHAIGLAEARGPRLLLLYTETSALYERHGFVGVAQHAFTGDAPSVAPDTPALEMDATRDRVELERLLASRTPVSGQVALTGAPGLAIAALATEPDLKLAYLASADALVVYERDGDAVVLVDIVAAALPSMAQIVAALPRPIRRLTTLFPPDRLDWSGTAVPDDTGLMSRGPLPLAMRRPFRLPPTTEF